MARTRTIDDEALLKHAREVFLESGAFGTTKEIARRAGISEGVIFQRFPTKAELFLAAMVPAKVDIASIMHTDKTEPREALAEIGHNMLAYFRGLIPKVMHLMTHPNINMDDVARHFKTMPPQDITNALTEWLAEGHRAGRLNAPNPMASASLIMSAIHSLAVFEMMAFHGDTDLDHAVEFFIDALWTGLAPGKEPT
jgi:AcrR family transcriptional regulator